MYILNNFCENSYAGRSKDEYFADIENGEYSFCSLGTDSRYPTTQAKYISKTLKILCEDGSFYGKMFNCRFFYFNAIFKNWQEFRLLEKHSHLVIKVCQNLARLYIKSGGTLGKYLSN